MSTENQPQYQHLEPRPGSNYRQWFLKGRRIRAAIVDEVIHGPDPRTPEEFAEEYQVPLEAVLEALDYVARNRSLIEQEREREAANLRARGLIGPANEDSTIAAPGEPTLLGELDRLEKAKPRPTKGSQALSLKREQTVYEAGLARWLSDHEGEYVLIKGDTVEGFYKSRDEALAVGYSRFGIGPLLVKQVSPSEPIYNIPNAVL
jgi:hypothetical protein